MDGLDAADRREALRHRPRERARAERRDPPLLRRARDLPDRPLPRQGDGPEPARAAVRERDLRADLEPPVRRPRRDHGRRVDRDRGPRRLLRAGGRDPRRLPEPPAPARRPDCDGAADRLHRRVGAQREGEGAARDAPAGPEARRPRPVRPGLRRGQEGARLPRGAGRRAGLAHGDVRRREAATSTTGAGPARRSTSASASGCAKRETTIAIQFKRAPHPPFAKAARRRSCEPNVLARPRPARRGRLARDRREGARAMG